MEQVTNSQTGLLPTQEEPKELTPEEKRRLERENKKKEVVQKNWENTLITRKEAYGIAENMAQRIATEIATKMFEQLYTAERTLLVNATVVERLLISKGVATREDLTKETDIVAKEVMENARRVQERRAAELAKHQPQIKQSKEVSDYGKENSSEAHTHDNDQTRTEKKGD